MSENIYHSNKYHDWYYSIITNAKNQPRVKNGEIYFENHHIIPKSCGGSNDPENLILLTAKEHFVVHHLLTKMMRDSKHKAKMVSGFFRMCTQKTKNHKNRYFPNARLYETARRYYSESMKSNNPMHHPEIAKKFRRKRPEQSLVCKARNEKYWSDTKNKKALKERNKKNRFNWKITNVITNKTSITNDLLSFCKENNIGKSGLYNAMKYRNTSKTGIYKGEWKLEKIVGRPKPPN